MTKPYKITDKLELPHTRIELRDDGIIQFFYGDRIEYTMKETEELERAVEKITGGVTHKSLRVAGKFSNIDVEVMRYLSRGRGTLFTLADSFVIQSLAQKIIANFYLKINKPVLPTRFFNKIEEADVWLQSLDNEELQRMHKLKILQFNK
ncbi:MAG: DUF7793 family protein [Bacteroidia bacterium]